MAEALLFGAGGFLGYFAVVTGLLRFFRRISPAIIVTLASILFYGLLLAVIVAGGLNILFWPLSSAYWFLALCFLMAFGAIYKSISLRILLDLLDRPGRSDSYDAVLARYVEEESYENRLKLVVTNGLATYTPGGFQLTDKGRRLAARVHAVQKLFKIQRSG